MAPTQRLAPLPHAKGTQPKRAVPHRWLLVEHLNDVVYAIVNTKGCHEYVRDAEGLSSLRKFAYGSNTRWNYWISVAEQLQPASSRCPCTT